MTAGKKFVPLFLELDAKYKIPAQFLYALAGRESRWNPRKVAKVKGEATAEQIRRRAVGLFQITKGVVTDYNETHGTAFTKRDMLDAGRNAEVGAWYLATRVLPRFDVAWGDGRTIALLAQAWNSGPGGTRRVLDSLDVQRPTVDDVRAAAQRIVAAGVPFAGLQPKAYRWLAERKTKWVKGVARDTLKAFADPNFHEPPGARAPGAFWSWWRRLRRCRFLKGGTDGG